ncbi:anthranilate synthase component I family protein [Acinetobacter rudis]|uniref:anthranilate synthase component I family protein n=1 Tax=Acinetobacter rudis TaxID=632955 RepID=UPI00280E7864|nr:anthranilate synthase component I family protein [Acinetobacter rudis]MDQ8953891.1 anthranilate synthase component I family protein [Acinetobacter rudis]
MSTKPIFKEFFANSDLNAPIILQAFSDLYGCIYLNDNNHPCIGFLPDHYVLFKNKKWQYFQKNGFNQYKETNDNASLSHTFPIHPDEVQSTQTGFEGGYMGFIDYNFAASQFISSPGLNQPQVYLGCYHSYLKKEQSAWFFYSHNDAITAQQDLLYLKQKLEQYLKDPAQQLDRFSLNQKCAAKWSKAQYQHAFQRIQDYIIAGDCYQINLTQAFTAEATGSLIHTAEQFWQLTQAPYSGYLKLDEFELLSCSPELFIEFSTQQKLITKPIKGTMPRDADPVQDQINKQQLINSTKDQAENLMIVDLLRNDLSVYAEIGSVKTPQLFAIESFNQVHHMVSEIHATLKADVNPLNLLLSALPGGSITGAPKIRAMQIIEELEAAPRGAYCGSMGYFNFNGTGSWNILIRSIQKYQNQLSIWAGGGITIASDCDAEYQECLDKVSAMLELINTWQRETP